MKSLQPVVSLGSVGALLALTSACVMTREEGEQMERDLRAVEQEFAEFKLEQQRHEAERIARLKRMAESLEQSDESARKADADFFVRIDELILQVQTLSGRIEEMEHRLAQLEAAQASASGPITAEGAASAPGDAPGAPEGPALPEDKEALYELAKKAHDEGRFEEARQAFRVFSQRYPDDAVLSDNSLFWIGEGYFKEGTYDKAILTFQEVINKYPKSDKADASIYKIGRSFEALGLKDDAILFYEDLIAKYPKSSLVRDAKKRIRSVKKDKKKSRRRQSSG